MPKDDVISLASTFVGSVESDAGVMVPRPPEEAYIAGNDVENIPSGSIDFEDELGLRALGWEETHPWTASMYEDYINAAH